MLINVSFLNDMYYLFIFKDIIYSFLICLSLNVLIYCLCNINVQLIKQYELLIYYFVFYLFVKLFIVGFVLVNMWKFLIFVLIYLIL